MRIKGLFFADHVPENTQEFMTHGYECNFEGFLFLAQTLIVGDVIKLYTLKQKTQLPHPDCVALGLVERLLEMIALVGYAVAIKEHVSWKDVDKEMKEE